MGNCFLSHLLKNKIAYTTTLSTLFLTTFVCYYFNIYDPVIRKICSIFENFLANQKRLNRPKRIILIRHGESIANKDKEVYSKTPDNKIPLSALGRDQANEAGRILKNLIGEEKCKFYVSPLLRTKQTFENIAKHFDKEKYKYIEDPRIREQEWGNYQDHTKLDNIMKKRSEVGKFYFRFETGESGADVYDRASQFLATLHRDLDCNHMAKKHKRIDNIIIITHGLFIRLFLMRYFKWTVEYFDSIPNPKNCAIVLMGKNEKGYYELKTNLTK